MRKDSFEAIGMIVAGLAWITYTCSQLVHAIRSTGWPQHPATILENSTGRGRCRYFPKIRYRYTVGGIEQIGSRLTFGGVGQTGVSLEAAEEFLKSVPVGEVISVRVCPSEKGLCVVVPGLERGWWIPIVVGGMMVFVGACSLFAQNATR
jgi:hypothetical protein